MAAGQQPDQRGQDRPVSPRQPRRPDLAPEHGELAAQEEDLGVFGPVGAGEQGKPAEHPEHRQVSKLQWAQVRTVPEPEAPRSHTANSTALGTRSAAVTGFSAPTGSTHAPDITWASSPARSIPS